MIKRIVFLLVSVFALSLASCKKNCVHCHHIKVYEGAAVGVFDIIKIEEACGRTEQRKFTKQKTEGTDNGGDFHTFWECGLYEENFE